MQVKWNQKTEVALNVVIEYGLKNFGEKAAYTLYQQIKSYRIADLWDTRCEPERLIRHIK